MSVIFSDPRDEGGTGLYNVYVGGNFIGAYGSTDEAKAAETQFAAQQTSDNLNNPQTQTPGYGTSAIAGSVNATLTGPPAAEAGRDAPFFDPSDGKYHQNIHYADGTTKYTTVSASAALAQGATPGTAVPTNPNGTSNALVQQTLDGIDPRTRPQSTTAMTIPVRPVTATLPTTGLPTFNVAPHASTAPAGIMPKVSAAQIKALQAAGSQSAVPGTGDGNPYTAPGAEAPAVNRDKIDTLLSGLSGYQSQIAGLANENRGMSAAEAQLYKSDQLAKIRAATQLQQNQQGALGAARSVRNRGDQALAERQAIGEQAYLGQEQQRQDVTQQAELEGNLANLRATEETADRTFRLNALSKAADLGLNSAALELDISKADLGSATNWINQEFDQLKQNGQLDLGYAQLDETKAKDLLGFTRDMAAIQFNYDQMGVQDQQATNALLMQKYGIDQQTYAALQSIKDNRKLNWGQIATTLIGGAASGATAAIAHSDRTLKRRFDTVTENELEELFDAITAQTWEYSDQSKYGFGRRLGPMAQDLERTRLGKSMVVHDQEGKKMVNAATLALATASGLALVHDRLKSLETSTAPAPEAA